MRGPVQAVRPVEAAGAFQQNLTNSGATTQVTGLAQSQQQKPDSKGLLSTGVQMMLAETRTQEAGAPFVPQSNVDRALDSYVSTQAKVRETIRGNIGYSPQERSFAPEPQTERPTAIASQDGQAAYGAAAALGSGLNRGLSASQAASTPLSEGEGA